MKAGGELGLQVLFHRLLPAFLGLQDEEDSGGAMASVPPTVREASLKDQAIARVQQVPVIPDLVFNLTFKAEDKLVSQMDNRFIATASPRLQDHQQWFHGLVAQA